MRTEFLRRTDHPLVLPGDEIERRAREIVAFRPDRVRTLSQSLRLLNTEQAALALGIPHRQLKRFLTGSGNDMHLLYALSRVFGCDMADLYWLIRTNPLSGRSDRRERKGKRVYVPKM